MSLIHINRQGYITKASLPQIARQRGGVPLSPELMLYGDSLGTTTTKQATFTDANTFNSTFTENGTVLKTLFSPFTRDGTSMYFDGTNDWLDVSYSSDFSLGATYTIECWVNATALNATAGNYIFSIANTNTTNFGNLNLWVNASGLITANCRPSTGGALVTITGQRLNLNGWHHIALVVSSNAATLYLNGISQGNATYVALDGTQTWVSIGGLSNGGAAAASWQGYISNLRVVKGTAVYTAAFTPLREELTAITNTVLLVKPNSDSPILTNRIFDTSSSARTITYNGNIRPSNYSPFSTGGSIYSDGVGDWILLSTDTNLLPEAGPFTLEMWYNYVKNPAIGYTALASWAATNGTTGAPRLRLFNTDYGLQLWNDASQIFAELASATNTSGPGPWTHVVVQRDGSNILRIFKNGLRIHSSTNTANWNGGILSIFAENNGSNSALESWISNPRFVKGRALYYNNFTPSTTPLTTTQLEKIWPCLLLLGSGTNGSTTFTDSSPNAFTVTPAGNAQISTAQAPTGMTSSILFDGVGDRLDFPAGLTTAMGGGLSGSVHTIEMWVRPTSWNSPNSYRHGIYGAYQAAAGNGRWVFSIYGQAGGGAGKLAFSWTTSTSTDTEVVSSTYNIPLNTWTHIAVVIDATTNTSSTIRFFVAGQLTDTFTGQNLSTHTANYSNLYIGSNFSQYFNDYAGYISNFRHTTGLPVYTTPYTVPTLPLANGTNYTAQASLLITGSGSNGTTTITDSGPYGLSTTRVGTPSISTVQAPTGMTSSIYFPSNGSYYYGSNSAFDVSVGTLAWSFDCWVYPVTAGFFFAIGNGGAYGNSFVCTWGGATANKFSFQQSNGSSAPVNITTSGTYTANQWYHFAVTKESSGIIKLFINGTQQATATHTGAVTTATTFVLNGLNDNNGLGSSGGNFYLSNIRFIRGSPIYTGNFTPPTLPLSTSTTIDITNANTTTLLLNNTSQFPETNRDFLDSSGNKFAVSITGNVAQSTLNPFNSSTSGSAYFDGSGDYLSTTEIFNFGSNNWTVEFWINFTAAPSALYEYRPFYPLNHAAGYKRLATYFYNSAISVGYATVNIASSAALSWTTGQWYHIAFTRNGNTWNIWRDGVSVASATDSSILVVDPAGYKIGENINGYISNHCVTVGTALYTSTFTPSAAPLSAVSGTRLLLLTNQTAGFKDGSAKAYPIVRSGDVIQSTQSYLPSLDLLKQGSLYLGGTASDYITLTSNTDLTFGTSAYTVEFWLYMTNYPGANCTVLDLGNATNSWGVKITNTHTIAITKTGSADVVTSAARFVRNSWNHIAISRASTNVNATRIFVNGELVTSGTDGNSWTVVTTPRIGHTTNVLGASYISNLRITKLLALYTAAFTPSNSPLLYNQQSAGSSSSDIKLLYATNNNLTANRVALDAGPYRLPITTVGEVTQTQFSPFSTGGSAYFDGNGDGLHIANNSLFDFGTGDFTIECWFYIAGNSSANGSGNRTADLFSCYPASGSINGYTFAIGGNATTTGTSIAFVNYVANTAYFFEPTLTIPQLTWHHVAVVRSGTTTTIYFNGTNVGSAILGNQNVNTSGNIIKVGRLGYGTGLEYKSELNGYMSNVRVLKGVAQYTANFTPSTTPLTAVRGTSLLLPLSNIPQIIDSSTNKNAVVVYGDTRLDARNPFTANELSYKTGSIYFDGTGDYLSVANNAAFNLTSGNFTIQGWFYGSSVSSGTIVNKDGQAGLTYPQYQISLSTSKIYADVGTGNSTSSIQTLSGTTTLSSNTWYHFAFVKSGTTLYLFLNGSLEASATQTATMADGGRGPTIGARYSNDTYFTGYLSNICITKGTALYTANFTPSTTPLTAVSGTSLLLLANNRVAYNDTGNKYYSLQPVGRVQTSTSEYPGTMTSSTYFPDGTSWFSVANGPSVNLNSWTLEFFIKCGSNLSTSRLMGNMNSTSWTTDRWTIGPNNGNNKFFMDIRNYDNVNPALVSSTNIMDNAWHHIAIVATDAQNIKLYVDGTLESTISGVSTGSIDRGNALQFIGWSGSTNHTGFQGYISNMRWVLGYALYLTNFSAPTAPLDNSGFITNNIYGVYQLV